MPNEERTLSEDSADRIKRAIQTRQRTFRRNLERRVTDIQGMIQWMLLDSEVKPWAE